jgi:uncharacterized protein
VRAVDAWINPNPPEVAAVWREQEHPRDVATRLFKHRADEILNGVSMAEMVDKMNASGIERGVLTAMPESSPWPIREFAEWVAKEVAARPNTFIGSTGVEPIEKMEAVRTVDWAVRELDFKLIRLMPAVKGIPPTHPLYYPIFAKCVELGVPVSMTVGVPGPLVPADPQHPRHLDRVCADFPELVVIASHMGNPWTEELVAYMAKYPNLYLMTSAWAPRHYPKPILDFLNSSRGRHKVMFATDYPLMGFERCGQEAQDLPFKDEATRTAFLRDNALRVLGWD